MASDEISERHRHRYEFNNEFKEKLVEKGLRITGVSPDGRLAEIVEIGGHPWFLGCQFHPEFKSRPTAPHPLFSHFIRAALSRREDNQRQGEGLIIPSSGIILLRIGARSGSPKGSEHVPGREGS